MHLTHADRELWPGITKRDLAEYWLAVADHALPEIAGRPLALVRCPAGIDGERFFQKHGKPGFPKEIRAGACDEAPYLVLDTVSGLLACAQVSAIELHAWGSREPEAEHPDRLVFDLDPAEDVAFAETVRAAHEVRARLRAVGLESFCRTTGGKGLHVVAPLRPQPDSDWTTTRAWCRAFAESMVADQPDRFVSRLAKIERHGKILVDWLRNGLGSTAVASFSPRARPGATVATRGELGRGDAKISIPPRSPSRRCRAGSPGSETIRGPASTASIRRCPAPAPEPCAKPSRDGDADGGTTDLARASPPRPGVLSGGALHRAPRPRHAALSLHQPEDRASGAHGHARRRDRRGADPPRSGEGVRVQEGPLPHHERGGFRERAHRELQHDDGGKIRPRRQSIDPIYYDSSYYLVPDGDAGQDVYVVLREAIAEDRSGGAVARGDRPARAHHCIMPMQNGMVVHTLHEERDLNSPQALFEDIPALKPDSEMVKLATQLIDRQTGKYDPADVEDHYEARLRAVIDSKLKGEGLEPEPDEEEDRGNVIDLMAALKKSLGQQPVTKAAPEKPAGRQQVSAEEGGREEIG